MKKTLCKRLCCAVLAMLLLAALCGCSMLKDTKAALESSKQDMDALLLQLMTCVENHDEEGAQALFYAVDQAWDFEGITNYWPVHSTDSFEQRDLNYTKNFSGKEAQTITSAVYCVHSGSEDYQVTLVKRSDANASGIYSFNVTSVQELLDAGIEPVGSAIPAASRTLGQWCFLGFWVLALVFVLITIIDIARKKPKKYGLWIVLALVFIGLQFSVGSTNVSIRFLFGILQKSQWVKTLNGTNTASLSLPLGAIIYWSMRKTLLKKKEAHTFAGPVDQSAAPEPTTGLPPQEPTQEL